MTAAPLARLILCCTILLRLLPACTTLPVYSDPPAGISIEPVARVDAGAPFAPDPAGTRLAIATDGLALFDVATRSAARLAADTPRAVAWAPDGRRLAAVFPAGSDSQLRLYDTAGRLVAATAVPGNVCALLWRGNDEVLVAALELKLYSFGANFSQVLYRWDGAKPPVRSELFNSTLRAKVHRALGPVLPRLFTIALSPYGDAVVYTRLHDPPAFSPFLSLMLRNLATGSEREVAAVALGSGGALFAGPDDTMWYGDGRGETVLRDPWQERKVASFPHPGSSLAVSPGGRTLFVDGRLYRTGQLLTTFPADAAGAFNADGTRLFVRHGKRLYLVAGLPADPPPAVPAGESERLLTLRQWRSEGLIKPADFAHETERMGKP